MNQQLNEICKNAVSTSLMLLGLLYQTVCLGQIFTDQAEELGVNGVISSHNFGSGLSTYDYDNDGLDDISICDSFGTILFYHNTGEGFEEVDLEILAPGYSKSIIWVDYDNDGLVDLFLTTYLGPNILYKNMGDFEFVNYTDEAYLPLSNGLNSGASFGDYDRDGFLDLYICKYAYNIGNPPVSPISHNRLYHNNGDGTFSDVTLESGVETIPSISLQSVWLDINNDNWPDLHVINDRYPGNFLFLNNGDGTFTDVTIAYGMSFPNNCVMSNSVCDFDKDGDLDIYMTNSGGPTNPNILAINQGESFQEDAASYGLSFFQFAWGSTWIDADNDSWEDIFITLPDGNPNHLLMRHNPDTFVDSPNELSVENNYMSYAPAKGDFNNDGYPDIAVQSVAPNHPYVLMNAGGDNNYVKLTLQGTSSNKSAIGSWIKVYFNNQTKVHYTLCGENYHGQNSQHNLFGLGSCNVLDSVSVIYPSGHQDKYYNLPTDTFYTLTEGETYEANISTESATSFCEGDSIILDAGIHYSYLWSNGESTRYSTVHTSGTHSVVVSNEFGVSTSSEIFIEVHPLPEISMNLTPNLCAGDSTGSIHLVNQKNTPIDTIIWSNNMQGNPIENLPSGNYDFECVDANGCSTIGTIPLFDPSAIQFFTSSTPETSGSADGSITITIFGGIAPYEIYLDTELVASPINNLEAGIYSFTIIDNNGCTEYLDIEVQSVLNNAYTEYKQMTIYPNPVENIFHIESEVPIRSIQIQSLDGKGQINIPPNTSGSYSLEYLSRGIYVMKIIAEGGLANTVKIVKE